MVKRLNCQQGISLIELIIVITILLFLIALGYWAVRGQMAKGRDAKRKDDLERIRVAFEDYFNDHGCYPDISILQNCGGDDLAPYLKEIPCDPGTGEPYVGVAGPSSLDSSDCNNWYKVYARLENESDPVIAKLGLSEGAVIEEELVNYGVASPNATVANVPPTTFICSNGEPAQKQSTCGDEACDGGGTGDCGTCGCLPSERVVCTERATYCCPDDSCSGG